MVCTGNHKASYVERPSVYSLPTCIIHYRVCLSEYFKVLSDFAKNILPTCQGKKAYIQIIEKSGSRLYIETCGKDGNIIESRPRSNS